MDVPFADHALKPLGAKANIDIALLRTFVAAVDLGGVARAAERVGRSQPATSLQLKRLEDIAGAALFRKNGRGLSLTEGGDILLSYARRLLELNDETVTAVTTLRLSGSIRLGISQDFAEGWLTQVLARFARAHSSIVMEVKADRNAVLFESLARQQLDFALTFGEENCRGAIDLGRVPVVWIGPKDRSWQNVEPIPLVLFEPPCGFRRAALEALEAAGVPWRLAFSSPSLSSQWSAVEAGLGVSVRTPIGLRPSLVALGDGDGLPPLPATNLRLLMHPSRGKAGTFDAKAAGNIDRNGARKVGNRYRSPLKRPFRRCVARAAPVRPRPAASRHDAATA